ncbi:hypothetical protein ACJ73_05598 [Blastomyces percursus]|uniref:Uncharacterized protein n=1 Tax=Blastomyces percursus TaxID=1658174 RepID=A0A1J9QS57_9EURO|nr:hypothetical protein ACJ73_05598 [Blastomyces percursus]
MDAVERQYPNSCYKETATAMHVPSTYRNLPLPWMKWPLPVRPTPSATRNEWLVEKVVDPAFQVSLPPASITVPYSPLIFYMQKPLPPLPWAKWPLPPTHPTTPSLHIQGVGLKSWLATPVQHRRSGWSKGYCIPGSACGTARHAWSTVSYGGLTWQPRSDLIPGCEELVKKFHAERKDEPSSLTTLTGHMRFKQKRGSRRDGGHKIVKSIG